MAIRTACLPQTILFVIQLILFLLMPAIFSCREAISFYTPCHPSRRQLIKAEVER